jgi:hypothetical protein
MKHGYTAFWAKNKKTGEVYGLDVQWYTPEMIALNKRFTYVIQNDREQNAKDLLNSVKFQLEHQKPDDVVKIENLDLYKDYEKTGRLLTAQLQTRGFLSFLYEQKTKMRPYPLFIEENIGEKLKQVDWKDYDFFATKAKGKNAPYKLDEKIAKFNDKRHSKSQVFMLILN